MLRTIFSALVAVWLLTQPASAMQDRRIALSFDDAPRGDGPMFSGPARAAALISALASVDAPPSVFFVTPRGFPTPESRQRIEGYARAGHLIANHSNTHPWAHRTETAEYIADIDAAEAALQGLSNRRAWFRFPYLDEGRDVETRDALRQALAIRGLMNGYVTVDTYDWYFIQRWEKAVREGIAVDLDAMGALYVGMIVEAAAFYAEKAVATFGRQPAHMLLLHENDLAALYVDELILALRAAGWEIIDPDTAYADPIASLDAATLFSGQGRIAALAVDQGMSAYDFDHPAANQKAIDARLVAARVFGAP